MVAQAGNPHQPTLINKDGKFWLANFGATSSAILHFKFNSPTIRRKKTIQDPPTIRGRGRSSGSRNHSPQRDPSAFEYVQTENHTQISNPQTRRLPRCSICQATGHKSVKIS